MDQTSAVSNTPKVSNKRVFDSSNIPDDLKNTGCFPFWNEHSSEWSGRLPSCIMGNLLDLTIVNWTTSTQRLALNSWFTVNMKAHTLMSTPQHPANNIDEQILNLGNNKPVKKAKISSISKKVYDHPLRSRIIRIYPTNEQREGLDRWFGAVRFCYNKLVERFRKVGQGGVNLTAMTAVIKETEQVNTWLKDIPCEIKGVAVMDFYQAREGHFAKLKKMRSKGPNVQLDATFKFRSKRDYQQSFSVRARDMIHKKGLFAFINLGRINASEKLPDKVDTSVRFVKDRLNRYHLIVPCLVPKKETPSIVSNKIVSLDPGERTFQTTYDTSGLVTEWGKDDRKQLFRLCRITDKIQSSIWKKKGSKRRSTKKAWYRAMDKIKNKVKEVHRKMSKWLCENYKVILIPKFESSQMTKRTARKLNLWSLNPPGRIYHMRPAIHIQLFLTRFMMN